MGRETYRATARLLRVLRVWAPPIGPSQQRHHRQLKQMSTAAVVYSLLISPVMWQCIMWRRGNAYHSSSTSCAFCSRRTLREVEVVIDTPLRDLARAWRSKKEMLAANWRAFVLCCCNCCCANWRAFNWRAFLRLPSFVAHALVPASSVDSATKPKVDFGEGCFGVWYEESDLIESMTVKSAEGHSLSKS